MMNIRGFVFTVLDVGATSNFTTSAGNWVSADGETGTLTEASP